MLTIKSGCISGVRRRCSCYKDSAKTLNKIQEIGYELYVFNVILHVVAFHQVSL